MTSSLEFGGRLTVNWKKQKSGRQRVTSRMPLRTSAYRIKKRVVAYK